MELDAALPKRRLNFTASMKQQAIAWIRGPGRDSPARAVAHFRSLNWEVNSETMDKWWRQRDKISTAGSSSLMDDMQMDDKPPRWALLSTPQEIALASVIRRRARKVRVSAKWIGLAVRQMYPETTSPNFNVSKTWLHGFAQRHGLALVGTTVVAASDHQHRRRDASVSVGSSASSSSSAAAKKSQSARTMSLHDVLYEEKPVTATIAA